MSVINRIFQVTIMISISGSITALMLYIFKNFIFRHTSAGFTSVIYKAAMISFILPLFFFKDVDSFIVQFIKYSPLVIVKGGSPEEKFYGMLINNGFAKIVTIIWFAGLMAYLAVKLAAYIRLRKCIKNECYINKDREWNITLERLCEKLDIKTKGINLMYCKYLCQPCVTGIYKHYILIPEYLRGTLSEKEIEIILTHELTHVKKRDTAAKTIIFVLSSLNWFNPIMHKLKDDMYEWMECTRDEQITESKSSEYKRVYADTLIKLNEAETVYRENDGVLYFGKNKEIETLKRRIKIIMGKKEKSKIFIKAVVLSGLCSVMFCSAAAAYDMDTLVMNTFSSDLNMMHEEEIISSEPDRDYSKLVYYDFDDSFMQNAVNYIPDESAEYFIVYEDGTTERIENYVDMKDGHNHNYVEINVDKHVKHSDGSCTVYIYAAEKCTICGKILMGEKINAVDYENCPH